MLMKKVVNYEDCTKSNSQLALTPKIFIKEGVITGLQSPYPHPYQYTLASNPKVLGFRSPFSLGNKSKSGGRSEL